VVADCVTGSLMHYDPAGCHQRLAEAVNTPVADPGKAKHNSQAGRRRCMGEFSWARIAETDARDLSEGVRVMPGVVGVWFDGV
jgi:alpha-maltose-1-phosphate synthase